MDTNKHQREEEQEHLERKLHAIASEIEGETNRAMRLHRGMNSLHESYAVLLEEVDEFWELVKVNPKKLTLEQQAQRMAELRKELLQIGAMCVRSIADLNL
jgi:hypothetical protein